MSRDQVDRVTKIVNDGLNEIESASQVPIDLKSKGTEATLEEVEEYVKSPALLAARDASRQRLKDVRALVQKQIADVLNNQQNAAYKTMLGPPFDVAKLVRPGMQRDEHELLVMSIVARFGSGRAACRPQVRHQGRPAGVLHDAPDSPDRRGAPQLPHHGRPVQAICPAHHE